MDGKRFWRALALVVVVLSVGATVVMAGAGLRAIGQLAGGPAAIEHEPDEDGYSGPLPLREGAVPESEPGAVSASTRASQSEEPRPDEDGYAGPVETGNSSAPSSESRVDQGGVRPSFQAEESAEDSLSASPSAPGWSSFRYFFAPGSALLPRDDDTTWEYGSYGCVYSSAGTDMFTMHLNLPEGSRIDYLRIYYRDTSGMDSIAYITAYDAEGGYTDLTSADSAGTGGYGYRLSAFVGHVVDNQENTYALNWDPNENSSSMRLCGLRVAYRLPD
jgi:hypothetical protein